MCVIILTSYQKTSYNQYANFVTKIAFKSNEYVYIIQSVGHCEGIFVIIDLTVMVVAY